MVSSLMVEKYLPNQLLIFTSCRKTQKLLYDEGIAGKEPSAKCFDALSIYVLTTAIYIYKQPGVDKNMSVQPPEHTG